MGHRGRVRGAVDLLHAGVGDVADVRVDGRRTLTRTATQGTMVADGPSIHTRSRSPRPWVMQLRDDTGVVVATRCGWLVTP